MSGLQVIASRISEYEDELSELETQLYPFQIGAASDLVTSTLKKCSDTKDELNDLKVRLKEAIEQVDHDMAAADAVANLKEMANTPGDISLTDDGNDDLYEDNANDKTPFDELYDNDDLYNDDDPGDTLGNDEEPVNAEALIKSVEHRIMRSAINFVKKCNLDPSKFQKEIEASYYELRDEIMDRADDDATQLHLHLDNILEDIPKVVESHLPDDGNDANDAQEPSEIHIDNEIDVDNESNADDVEQADILPNGLIELLDKYIEKHIWNRFGGKISDHEEVRDEVIRQMKSYKAMDEWESKAELYVRNVSQHYVPPKELVNNGFELSSKYWKDKSSRYVDSKKLFFNALVNYEQQQKVAEAASGFDQLVQYHFLKRHLENVEVKAGTVQKGIKHNKKSKGMLDGVPYAVKQATSEVDKKIEAANKAFTGLTFEKVQGNPELESLWDKFLKDHKNKAHADQFEFKQRYDKPERTTQLRDFAVNKLNLQYSYYDKLNEDINDDEAWKKVMSAVRLQLLKAFPVPFYEFVVLHAAEEAKKL